MNDFDYDDNFSDVSIRSTDVPPSPPLRVTSYSIPPNGQKTESQMEVFSYHKGVRVFCGLISAKFFVTAVVFLKLLVLCASAYTILSIKGDWALASAIVILAYGIVLPMAMVALHFDQYVLILPYLLVQIVSCLGLIVFLVLRIDWESFPSNSVSLYVILGILLLIYAFWFFTTYALIRLVVDERHFLNPCKKREALFSGQSHLHIPLRSFAEEGHMPIYPIVSP